MALLTSAMTWLGERQTEAGGVSVTYTPLVGTARTVTAVPGERRDDSEPPASPGRVEVRERDYLITLADWTAALLTGTPTAGDRITETINGTPVVFEVKPRGTEQAWRYSEADRLTFRIHTKPIGA